MKCFVKCRTTLKGIQYYEFDIMDAFVEMPGVGHFIYDFDLSCQWGRSL